MKKIAKNIVSKDLPLSMPLAMLCKKYYGVFTVLLQDDKLERYQSTLYFISKYPDCSQQFLATYFDVDKAAMARIIDYLVEGGLVKRVEREEDKRTYDLKLTAKGLKKIPAIEKAFIETNKTAFNGINTSEQKQFLKIIEKALVNLSTLPSEQFYVEYISEKKLKK